MGRGARKNIILLEGSQASPVCLSDKCGMKVNMLEWLDIVGLIKGPLNLDFLN
jgi:hypothetical protein